MAEDRPTRGGVREPTRAEHMRALGAAMSSGMSAIDPTDLRALCARYGVPVPLDLEEQKPTVERVTLPGFTSDSTAASRGDLTSCRRRAGDRVSLAADQTGLTTIPDDQQSTSGTPIVSGVILAEPTSRLTPYIARGLAGSIAHYDRTLREPTTYKDYQSIRELLVTGVWDWHIPEETPEEIVERVRDEVSWIWAKIKGAQPGWSQLVEGMAVCVGFGFSLHEIVWREDERGIYPARFAYMDPSTVERWLFDEAQRDWLGAKFRAGGGAPISWVLPATGPTITDHRILRCTLGGRGNNLEGVPPTRAVDTLITMKQLLIKISAASAERFGCPVLVTRQDTDMERGIQPNEGEWQDLFDFMQYMAAMDTPAIKIPAGVILEYLSAQGVMPDFLPMIQYLDSAIHATFSTQAMALSHGSSHGSNALAQVQDQDFLRSIPYYARTIARPIDQLMRLMLVERGVELDVYPTLHWSMPEVPGDPGVWMDNLTKLVAIRDQLPEPVLQAALARMGLPPDSFMVEEEEAPTVERPEVVDGEESAVDALARAMEVQ